VFLKGAIMPRQAVPLTDAKMKNAKPSPNEYRLSDGGGLYLLVEPCMASDHP
jgi:hypothetical protein